jgi:hypothetical protein
MANRTGGMAVSATAGGDDASTAVEDQDEAPRVTEVTLAPIWASARPCTRARQSRLSATRRTLSGKSGSVLSLSPALSGAAGSCHTASRSLTWPRIRCTSSDSRLEVSAPAGGQPAVCAYTHTHTNTKRHTKGGGSVRDGACRHHDSVCVCVCVHVHFSFTRSHGCVHSAR